MLRPSVSRLVGLDSRVACPFLGSRLQVSCVIHLGESHGDRGGREVPRAWCRLAMRTMEK